MAKKKCYWCKKNIEESKMSKVLTHYICKDCYDEFMKSEQFYKERFIDFVWKLYEVEKPNYHQLESQYDELVNRYSFKPKGMYFALQYWLRLNEWNAEYLLFQVFPQAYYDAEKYFRKQQKISKSIQTTKISTDVEVVRSKQMPKNPPLKM